MDALVLVLVCSCPCSKVLFTSCLHVLCSHKHRRSAVSIYAAHTDAHVQVFYACYSISIMQLLTLTRMNVICIKVCDWYTCPAVVAYTVAIRLLAPLGPHYFAMTMLAPYISTEVFLCAAVALPAVFALACCSANRVCKRGYVFE